MKKLSIALLALSACFCLALSPAMAKDKPIKIGLSISDFETERWPVEEAAMKKIAEAAGAEFISQVANHDAKRPDRKHDPPGG
jgi:ABC-type xylose transport system substrate-binding protein